MKLWKVDQSANTVRQVDGEKWRGTDSEGDTCYENTHFAKEAAAWDELTKQAQARVWLAGRAVERAAAALRDAQAEAGAAAMGYAASEDNFRARQREQEASRG